MKEKNIEAEIQKRRRMRKSGWLLLLIVLLSAPVGGDDEKPLGIIIAPPEETKLNIRVWTDKEIYRLEELIKIHFEVNQDAYVYIYNINTQGKITLLFPNAFSPKNFLQLGKYTLPDNDRYSFIVTGAPGIEYIQAIASLEPIPPLEVNLQAKEPFFIFDLDPESLRREVEAEIKAKPREWAAAWDQFFIIKPGLSRLLIVTYPGEAEVYLNGEFKGLTPLMVAVEAGFQRITLVKEGYLHWSKRIYVEEDDISLVEVQLTPSLPPPEVEVETEIDIEITPLPFSFIGFNLADFSSFGFEVGFSTSTSTSVLLGTSVSLTGDKGIPEFHEIPPPEEPWDDEEVYNSGPELEFYLKLVIPFGEIRIEGGIGVAVQEKVHIAMPPQQQSIDLDIDPLPNGYRSWQSYFTTLGGVGLRSAPFVLSFNYHTRRGWVIGVGVEF